MMRKIAAILVIFLLGSTGVAFAASQYARLTCTPATTGTPPTTISVERTVVGSGTWTVVAGPIAPAVPPQSFVDTTRVSGVSYQYRCMFIAQGGGTPSDPTQAVTFVDNIGVPGKGVIDMTIITQ
jgi:hypothetical protein